MFFVLEAVFVLLLILVVQRRPRVHRHAPVKHEAEDDTKWVVALLATGILLLIGGLMF